MGQYPPLETRIRAEIRAEAPHDDLGMYNLAQCPEQ